MIFLGKIVQSFSEPYFVAEISGNHGGYHDRAMELMHAAKRAGADAVKIQCYDADDLTIPNNYIIEDGSPWAGKSLHELYKEAGTPKDWIEPLFDHAKQIGIPIFSSVYSTSGLELLERVKCPAYKIASYEANDIYFIKEVINTGKPIIVSVGTLSEEEIDRLYDILPEDQSIVLHCVSKYPTYLDELSLSTMHELATNHDKKIPVGFSCHSDNPISLSLASMSGAAMIEVHLGLDPEIAPPEEQPDYEFSFIENGLKWAIEQAKLARSSDRYKYSKLENAAHKFKRSLYAVEVITKGEYFTSKNVKSFRPNLGCSPHLLPNIIGRKSNTTIAAYTPMKMEYVE